MKLAKLLTVIFIATLLFSCDLEPFDEKTNSLRLEQTCVKEESEMFKYDDQSKVFTFETNDTKYLSDRGYTLWTASNVNAEEYFKPLSVVAVKESGRTQAGFGLVFCEQILDGKPFMLTVLINAEGFYTTGKVFDGMFSHINNGWKSSNHINKGAGIKNTIAVDYYAASNTFLLKINEYEITNFTVPEQITVKGSKSGFAVVIADNESFPNNPVKVTFEYK